MDVSTYNKRDELIRTKRNLATWKQYGYDSARRRTSLTISSAVTSYSYDHASRLTGITYPGSGGTDSMTYNALDTRLSRTENGATVNFRRSGPGVTDPVLSDSGATYTPGVSERRGSTTTYQHSGLKNATTQTGTAQTVTASRKYDAFGQVLGSTGTWQGPFGYAGGFGYQSSDRSGLQLLGHRYYDPSEGRFITKDPIKSGRNWFAYGGGGGNPVNGMDPTGLGAREICEGVWGALSDGWVNLSLWWSGADYIGPSGECVRVGGWPALLNLDGNALTINETVHLNDEDDYEDYLASKKWQAHEVRHIVQEQDLCGGNAISFFKLCVAGYILGGSHDGSPLERDADNAAGHAPKDPFGAGVFGVLTNSLENQNAVSKFWQGVGWEDPPMS